MNLLETVEKLKNQGYNEANAQARVCQDIILNGIAKGNLSRNVTIKGGVVMRNLSKDTRRATQDIDLDFIKYSISESAIELFIGHLELPENLKITIRYPIQELNHKDYKGKRVFVEIRDDYENLLISKIDIGVHKDLEIEQEEYCFDICFQEDGASLLMNSREQIIAEKLKSFLRFGIRSTRYKDVFDLSYLTKEADCKKLLKCIRKYIYEDTTLPVNDINEIEQRIERVFENPMFIQSVIRSEKNWMDISAEEALQSDIAFLKSLQNISEDAA